MIEMGVLGMAISRDLNQPLLLLIDTSNSRVIPICIGAAEAGAMAYIIDGRVTQKPLTHELAYNIVRQMGLRVKNVLLDEFTENSLNAKVSLCIEDDFEDSQSPVLTVDARPSDGIALALLSSAPILATEQVVADTSVPFDLNKEEEEREKFKDFVEGLNASDFKDEVA